MDTRNKILTAEAARAVAGPLAIVTGYFDLLRAEHARELAAIRQRIGEQTLVALVLPCPGEVFDIHARARMVAALRVIDYVVIAEDADALLAALHAPTVVHMEAGDVRRNREITGRIRGRHGAGPA
jgi:bifunctional ADP-heptose synthase (sugar kinase/adenylyltransferase)